MPLSDRKAGATNYPLNKILKIRSAVVVCFISIFSLNNSDNLKGRAIKFIITGSSSLEIAGKTAKFLVGGIFSFYLYQFSFEEFIKAKSDQLSYIYEERKNKVIDFILNGKDFKFTEDIFQEDFRKLFEEYAIYGGYPEVVKAGDIETKKIILKNIFENPSSHQILPPIS
jgi:predicted AAA+ superfamily ATPase